MRSETTALFDPIAPSPPSPSAPSPAPITVHEHAVGIDADDIPVVREQTIVDILVHGEEPTEAFLNAFAEDQAMEPLSDEELERQAMEHGGPGDAV